MMKRIIFGGLICAIVVVAFSGISFAQGAQQVNIAEIDKNMDLLRKDLRSAKKQMIAVNVPLTDVEATKFWPLYDQYAGEMTKQYDQFYGVIKDYAAAANAKTLTDAQATGMIKRWVDIQAELVKVKQKYIPIVEKVLPGKKAALFFQIDRRLYMLMDLQVASEVPLVMQ